RRTNMKIAWKKLLLVTACLSTVATAASLTTAEREKAIRYLSETRNGVIEAVNGISEAQWNFKPGPDRWSLAEIVEHLALIEAVVSNGVLPKMDQAPAGAQDRDAKQVDTEIVAKVLDRSTKYQAPPIATPTGRWTPAEALNHFLAGRDRTS